MDITITKAQVRSNLGDEAKDADVARFFGISTSAVAQWPENAPIPQTRALQARFKRPEWFDAEPVQGVA